MKWKNFIKEDQFDGDYKLVVAAVGLESAIKLAQALPSVYIYLKSPDKLFKPAKVAYVLDQYSKACPDNPFNPRQMALDTELSIREIYSIIENRKELLKQAALFDDT